jgi:hypothetical protein
MENPLSSMYGVDVMHVVSDGCPPLPVIDRATRRAWLEEHRRKEKDRIEGLCLLWACFCWCVICLHNRRKFRERLLWPWACLCWCCVLLYNACKLLCMNT